MGQRLPTLCCAHISMPPALASSAVYNLALCTVPRTVLVVLQAHFNMGNLYRQCAEFGRAIQRCAAAAASAATHGRTHSSAVPAWPACRRMRRQLNTAGHRPFLPAPRPLPAPACLQLRQCSVHRRFPLALPAQQGRGAGVLLCVLTCVAGLVRLLTICMLPCGMCTRALPHRHHLLAPLQAHHTPHPACLQTCTGDKDQATFNLKLALKLSGTLLPTAV